MRRFFTLIFCLFCLGAHAQEINPNDTTFFMNDGPHQWFRNPEPMLRQFPPGGGPLILAPNRPPQPLPLPVVQNVVVTGAVLDEFLRPIAGATVNGTTTDAEGRFFLTVQRAPRLTVRAERSGYFAHTVGFMPTAGYTQFVLVHLAKMVVTHKLPAVEGGTISQGGFWLTLPPKSVVTEDGKVYSG